MLWFSRFRLGIFVWSEDQSFLGAFSPVETIQTLLRNHGDIFVAFHKRFIILNQEQVDFLKRIANCAQMKYGFFLKFIRLFRAQLELMQKQVVELIAIQFVNQGLAIVPKQIRIKRNLLVTARRSHNCQEIIPRQTQNLVLLWPEQPDYSLDQDELADCKFSLLFGLVFNKGVHTTTVKTSHVFYVILRRVSRLKV